MSTVKKNTPKKLRAIETHDQADSSGRQRQQKRDEAIRKKLEQDFSKKGSSKSSRKSQKYNRIPGTVSALRPGQALTVKENMLVLEASQLMAAKRCDCVLVVNENDHLSGIFTAKDIAYRLVAEDLKAKKTLVIDIMTKNPVCVTSDTSATEALNLMVTRGFRHLPVCNEEGDIFGLLDITKCLYGALEKIERTFETSQANYNNSVLEGMQREWGNVPPAQLAEYMETLREQMSCPNLQSLLDGTPPAEVKYKTNVRDIAVMMKQLRTTAVLVTRHRSLAGIFTSKDIVLRVIAAGLDPEICTVARVMTPNPDTATPETSVLDALKLMNEGHYLNLPVLENGTITGMVDVLKLTYVTLEQMSNIEGERDGAGHDGPMWGRFWDSFGATDITDSASQLSDTTSSYLVPNKGSSGGSQLYPYPNISPQPSTSLSHLKSFPDISPNESASMVNQTEVSSVTHSTFTFKFTSQNNKTHRVVCQPAFSILLEAVRAKLLPEHGEGDVGEEEWLTLSYVDDEDDTVLISCDADVIDAVHLARKEGQSRVKLIVHDSHLNTTPTHLETTIIEEKEELEEPVAQRTVLAREVVHEEEKQEEKVEEKEEEKEEEKPVKKSKRAHEAAVHVPNELLLPAAITFLGVVILGVFVFSRKQR
ncbi:CBS domain-containing protein CBSCBSPB3 [Choanephora cucurbitarum]|uniref:CBS domain-containing protein CBSCBSPB3 n=1 Tax=Choanephora cucurbitarum TaxID=101091 RepID=A0A1C7NL85_9FUNG|nr:CBS domain-containing protein CBSCBSPB3 [Choanephora cucurbitarum]